MGLSRLRGEFHWYGVDMVAMNDEMTGIVDNCLVHVVGGLVAIMTHLQNYTYSCIKQQFFFLYEEKS